MNARYYVTAALVGGIVSFAWGSTLHLLPVFPAAGPKAFADSNAVVQVIKANAPENGIYLEGRGVFAVVAFRPDMAPKFESILPSLSIQLVIEIMVALVLAWVLLRLPLMTAFQTGILLAIIGVAAAMEQLLPQQLWYGFPRANTAFEAFGFVVGWFLLGLVLGALRNRMIPAQSA
jgi:hypothetical protein